MALTLDKLTKAKKLTRAGDPSSITGRDLVTPWKAGEQNESSLKDSPPVQLASSTSDPETEIKWQQTDNKSATNRVHNRQQSGNKPTTNRQRQKAPKTETGNKPSTQPATQPATKWQQTDNKPTTKCLFSELVGLQRELIFLLHESARLNRSKITPPITLEHISKLTNSSKNCIKVSLQRIEAKGCIIRKNFKTGRGGWSQYEIPDAIYQEVLLVETGNKVATNRQQTDNKPSTEPATEPATSVPSSSSKELDLKKLTNTGSQEILQNPPFEWEQIDASALSEIRFGRSQIAQVVQWGRLTPDELQDSICAFAFDLSENHKAKNISGSPLNYFMGILRKGPYAPPANYESPEDRQRRLYLEAKEQQQKRRQEIEARLENAEFEEWVESLSIEKRTELVPPKDFAKPGGTAHNYQMREYFRENVWPRLKKKHNKINYDQEI